MPVSSSPEVLSPPLHPHNLSNNLLKRQFLTDDDRRTPQSPMDHNVTTSRRESHQGEAAAAAAACVGDRQGTSFLCLLLPLPLLLLPRQDSSESNNHDTCRSSDSNPCDLWPPPPPAAASDAASGAALDWRGVISRLLPHALVVLGPLVEEHNVGVGLRGAVGVGRVEQLLHHHATKQGPMITGAMGWCGISPQVLRCRCGCTTGGREGGCWGQSYE